MVGEWVVLTRNEEGVGECFQGTPAKIISCTQNNYKAEAYEVDRQTRLLGAAREKINEPLPVSWPHIVVLHETRPARWGLQEEDNTLTEDGEEPNKSQPLVKLIGLEGEEASQLRIHPGMWSWPAQRSNNNNGVTIRDPSIFNFSMARLYRLLVEVQNLHKREPVMARWRLAHGGNFKSVVGACNFT